MENSDKGEGSGSGGNVPEGPEDEENAVFRQRRSSQYIDNENFPIAERVMEGMVESSGSGEGVEEAEDAPKADAVREGMENSDKGEGSGSGGNVPEGPEDEENAVFRQRRSSQYIDNENFPIAERVMEGMVESSGSGEGVAEAEDAPKADAVREGSGSGGDVGPEDEENAVFRQRRSNQYIKQTESKLLDMINKEESLNEKAMAELDNAYMPMADAVKEGMDTDDEGEGEDESEEILKNITEEESEDESEDSDSDSEDDGEGVDDEPKADAVREGMENSDKGEADDEASGSGSDIGPDNEANAGRRE